MLSPISSSPIHVFTYQPAEIVNNNLTESEVLSETILDYPMRRKGKLAWVERENMSDLRRRIEFINNLIDKVHITTPIKETPITIISLGSDSLLTEFYIQQQLSKAGYRDIAWRLIDTNYVASSQEFFKQFKAEATSNYKIFTTEQAYFNKLIDNKSLVEGDATRGTTILLSVAPPIQLKQPVLPVEKSTVGLDLQGRPQSVFSKANALYLLIDEKCTKEELSNLCCGLRLDKLIHTTGLKCYIDTNGQPIFEHNAYDPHSIISTTIAKILNSGNTLSTTLAKKFTLCEIAKALIEMMQELDKAGVPWAISGVSNYDISIANLRSCFANKPNSLLFASLERNVINIENSSLNYHA